MKLLKTYFLTALLIVSATTYVEAKTYGDYLASQKDMPTFEKYKIKKMNIFVAKTLDISQSDGQAWKYRGQLIGEYKHAPNFAGKYVIATISCGTRCLTNFVMDKEVGKIVGTYQSTMGSSYYVDSTMLIVNPLFNKEKTQIENMPANMDVRYYELKDNKLVLLKQINKDSISKSE